MKKCPRCWSENIEMHDYLGAKCIVCKDCGFDEACQLDVFPEEKKSQRAKGRYSPYKTGGKQRTRKR